MEGLATPRKIAPELSYEANSVRGSRRRAHLAGVAALAREAAVPEARTGCRAGVALP